MAFRPTARKTLYPLRLRPTTGIAIQQPGGLIIPNRGIHRVNPEITLLYRFSIERTLDATLGLGPTLNFVRATPATFFNNSGFLKTAASGEARFDHDPLTNRSLGLKIESARTNFALQNRDFTNAAWVKTTMTAAQDQLGLDGVANAASSLTATAGNATALQSVTLALDDHVSTFYIKRLIGSGLIEITVDNINFKLATLTTAYQRFEVTANAANPEIGIRITTSGDSVAVDYSGLEVGTFPTSAIETFAVSVTRNKEDINTTDVSWYTQGAGTMYVRASRSDDSVVGAPYAWQLSNNSNSDRISMASTTLQRTSIALRTADINGVSGNSPVDSWPINTETGLAFAWEALAGSANSFANGFETVIVGDTVDAPANITDLNVGNQFNEANQLNGHIQELRFYNVRKDDAFLSDLSKGLKTPSDR